MYTHDAIVSDLTRQKDTAERECKDALRELDLTMKELKSMTLAMKEQSDEIDAYINTVRTLEEKIEFLEKEDPDMSIYEDTMECPRDDGIECECERQRHAEMNSIDAFIVFMLTLVLAVVVALHGKVLSNGDL